MMEHHRVSLSNGPQNLKGPRSQKAQGPRGPNKSEGREGSRGPKGQRAEGSIGPHGPDGEEWAYGMDKRNGRVAWVNRMGGLGETHITL